MNTMAATIIAGMEGWESAVKDFHDTGMLATAGLNEQVRKVIEVAGLTASQLDKVQAEFSDTELSLTDSGKLIADMLSQYGGEEGKIAAENLLNGVNTVSDQLLATTKANMDAALAKEKESMFDYLDEAEQGLKDRAESIKQSMQAEFDAVATSIEEAFNSARESAITAIDDIIERLASMNEALIFGTADVSTGTTGTTTDANPEVLSGDSWLQKILKELIQNAIEAVTAETVPHAATGARLLSDGLIYGHAGEDISYRSEPTIKVENHIHGDVYGIDDLDAKVTQITLRNFSSGVYRGVN